MITIFPSYFKFVPYVSKIKAISRGNKTFNISCRGIKLLNKFCKTSVIIIASDKGFLTSAEAVDKGTGGKVVLFAS